VREISLRFLQRRMSAVSIKENLPFVLTADERPIALVVPYEKYSLFARIRDTVEGGQGPAMSVEAALLELERAVLREWERKGRPAVRLRPWVTVKEAEKWLRNLIFAEVKLVLERLERPLPEEVQGETDYSPTAVEELEEQGGRYGMVDGESEMS